jgi:hypothetical protein
MVVQAGFGDEYFNNSENIEAGNDKQFLERYKSILCSKSSEETMVKPNTYVLQYSIFCNNENKTSIQLKN